MTTDTVLGDAKSPMNRFNFATVEVLWLRRSTVFGGQFRVSHLALNALLQPPPCAPPLAYISH